MMTHYDHHSDDGRVPEQRETKLSSTPLGERLVAESKAFAARYEQVRELSATALRPVPLAAGPVIARRSTGGNLPIATGRDPCPRCAIRGDIGCEHQQPFEAAE